MNKMALNKKAINKFKREILSMAHEFQFECEYLNKYLEDSISMLKKETDLKADAKLYSVEADNYFWSVQHTHYFSCSFIIMLMQISETLSTQYFGHAKNIFGDSYGYRKEQRISHYNSVDNYLERKFGLQIKSKWWKQLAIVYQIRNVIVHDNGAVDPHKKLMFTNICREYKGFDIVDNQLKIELTFCRDALKIFRKALSAFFLESKDNLNLLKKHSDTLCGHA